MTGTMLGSVLFNDPAAARRTTHAQTSQTRGAATTAKSHVVPVKNRTPAKPRPTSREASESDAEAVSVRLSRHARDGGGGMMRLETAPVSVQTVGRQLIAMRSPNSTGLDLVANMPSVSIAMPDTTGFKGGSIFMRGFTDQDMALMLDGAPSSNAGYLQQNVDPENIESVQLTPGSSPIDAPATRAAAGSLDEKTMTPAKKMGGAMDFSYGTNNLSREFLRLESGYIGNSGVRMYISGSHAHARQWMGAGTNERIHMDVGVMKDFDNGSFVKFFGSWHNSMFTIDNYPTEAQFELYKKTGQGWNRTNIWNPASSSAGNYWKSNIDSWNQFFVSTQAHVILTKRLTLDVTPYLSTGFGFDGYGVGTVSGLGGVCSAGCTTGAGAQANPNAQVSNYWGQHWSPQVGLTAKLGYDVDRHNHVTFGYWYENNAISYLSPYMLTMESGRNPKLSANDYKLYTVDGQEVSSRYNAGYELNSFFISDTAKYLNDRLTVNAGFKYVMSNYWDHGVGVGTDTISSYKFGANSTAPLPHLSISYQFNEHNQIYVNAEGDFRQAQPSQLSASTSLPKNQYSITEQIGYRYNNKWFMLDLSAFNSNITNRLLTTYLPNTAYAVSNAGNMTVRGFDVMVAGRDYHHFSPFASFEYLHGTQDSNIPYGNTYLPTKGLQSILTPRVMANFGVSYNSTGFFGNFALHYTGPQSVTLVDDQRMPGFVTDTLAIGYHFKPFSFMKSPTFRLNFSNLTGSIVRVGTTGVANNLHNVTLLDGSTLAGGSGASFYVLPRFSMTGTVSTDF
ncbi:TonB-dependent receptor [Acetobacter musti]|nr:TonB-dependent receptor [Acetobacter musti]